MSTQEERQKEIQAKKARLAELKRRRDEISKGRPTMPDFSEVGTNLSMATLNPNNLVRSFRFQIQSAKERTMILYQA